MEANSTRSRPVGGLLQGVVQQEGIRRPAQLDGNGEPCLTRHQKREDDRVTVGRAIGIQSVHRVPHHQEYVDGARGLPYSHKDGAFSASGDSGSIVVDGDGHIVGLVTGSSSTTNSTDVTYLTPY